MDFDFDEWARLYQKSPEEFEQRRKAALEQLLEQSPLSTKQKEQLRGVLYAAPAQGEDPLQAALRAQARMWEAFTELQAQLRELHVSANHDGTISVRKTALSQFTQ